jgi:phage protein D
MTGRILIAVVLTLGAVMGVRLWNAHLIAVGDAQGADRVQTEWNTAEAKRLAAEATARMEAAQKRAVAEAAERDQEQAKQIEAERIAHEQAQREQAQSNALAAADSRNRSLLTTIAQLNADAAARLSSTGPQSCTSADIDAATTARTALGECSSRYTALGGVADKLSGQVSGLQDYVRTVIKPGQAGDVDDL